MEDNHLIRFSESLLEQTRRERLSPEELFKGDATMEVFIKALSIAGVAAMRHRSVFKEFIIDDYNKGVIEQLYYYFVRSDKFNGDLSKGIALAGPYGTGKTILMRAFIQLIKSSGFKIWVLSSRDIYNKIAESGVVKADLSTKSYFSQNDFNAFTSPLVIDDLGKEQAELVHYGSVLRPLSELLYQRYENGGLTFATSNFKLETFATKYTPEVADRLPEMFNEIFLPGQTRRK